MADQVVRLVNRVDAQVVLLAGDVRATQLLQDSLPDEVRARVRVVEGSRVADGSEAIDGDDARRLLNTAVAEDTTQLLEKLKEERGQDDRAADGLEATAAVLSEARAAAVLLTEEVDATLWFDSEPVPVATSRQALTDLGGDHPQEGRAAEVLRAALGTGAGIRIVPAAALPGEVAAILRW